jgi:hypothetical protein
MKMHWCTCRVNLSGQGHHIIVFDQFKTVSWPEVQVLMGLHGQENVFDIKPLRLTDGIDAKQEKVRLGAKYGRIVEQVFPGALPRMEMTMPGENEDQQKADADGDALPVNGNGPDDEPEDEPPIEPVGPATFKPGRHRPPAGV